VSAMKSLLPLSMSTALSFTGAMPRWEKRPCESSRAKTGLDDPHGIIFDEKHSEISVANHGNWAPLTREESLEGNSRAGASTCLHHYICR